MENNSLDIVIPTRNRGAMIDETLASIFASSRSDFSVWVIDQSENNETRQNVSKWRNDPRFNYIKSTKQGSNVARNLGGSIGRAPVIAFTDDNCVVACDWVDQIVDTFDAYEVDAIFGRVVDQSYSDLEDEVTPAIKIAVKDDKQKELYHGNRFKLDFGHGANMAFRRSTLEAVDGFDPQLGDGGPLRSWPEKDIGYRILQQNGKILYEPTVVIHHKQWRNWGEVKSTLRDDGFGAGAIASYYLMRGDWSGLVLMIEWMAEQGVQQMVLGAFKWHSWQKISAGIIQFYYPIWGFFVGLRVAFQDKPRRRFKNK